MKIVSIVGARPQFIKAAPIMKKLREAGHEVVQVHTGQHYDDNMSSLFFEELGIPLPTLNLGVGSGTHGKQTAAMLAGIEEVLLQQKPDLLMVFGDTNSTLAGALAACKLGITVAHVEAGLRSFNRSMPEEHNRVLTDHCSDLLFCPTQTAVDNLRRENITKGVHLVGDTMFDMILEFATIADSRSQILSRLDLNHQRYYLATVHRHYNTDDLVNLREILAALSRLDMPVVFPVHPRTRARINQLSLGRGELDNLVMTEPVGYLDMLCLEQHAHMILTDSGGVQKEAYFLGVPCVTLRAETEWSETVQDGWNILAGADAEKIVSAISRFNESPPSGSPNTAFGDGTAADKIIEIVEKAMSCVP